MTDWADARENEIRTAYEQREAQTENFRDRLARRGAAVQVAREAVIQRAKEFVARPYGFNPAPAMRALDAAVVELLRQEAKLKEEGR